MRVRVRIGGLCLCGLLFCLGIAPTAQANRELIAEKAVEGAKTPDKQIEGACGVAVGGGGEIYVSDYYHRVVDVFSGGGGYQSQVFAGVSPEGPCGLAQAGGALYVNYYHRGVVRLKPSVLSFDACNCTGVAVDASGNVYANHRTYVAVYQPSGAPLLFESQPLQIGLGSLGDSYGLAVFAGKVYVAEAADDTVKVYEPAVDPDTPSHVITGPPGGFKSLTDAALAIDPTNGHLLVADNLQPGYEHPEAGIDEFDAEGNFLDQLSRRVIDAEPVGLTVNAGGALYATSGNSEEANVFIFGQYSASFAPGAPAPGAEEGRPTQGVAAPASSPAAQASTPAGAPASQKAKKHKHKHRHRTKQKKAK